jgi:hypothetical protein
MQAPLCWTYLLHQEASESSQTTKDARAGQQRVSSGSLEKADAKGCRKKRLTAGSSTAGWKLQ